jgi:hypothetical protein
VTRAYSFLKEMGVRSADVDTHRSLRVAKNNRLPVGESETFRDWSHINASTIAVLGERFMDAAPVSPGPGGLWPCW